MLDGERGKGTTPPTHLLALLSHYPGTSHGHRSGAVICSDGGCSGPGTGLQLQDCLTVHIFLNLGAGCGCIWESAGEGGGPADELLGAQRAESDRQT